MTVTLNDVGVDLVKAGYEPLPITPGAKVPEIKNWSLIAIDTDKVQSWLDRGRGGHYVGLRTGEVVGVDVDVDNAEVTQALVDDAGFSLGDAPIRYGKPGRALMMFRTDAPWPKKSIKLLDPDGQEHNIEVLAKGQQFVALGKHHSGREYTWENGSPLDTPAESLPSVTESEISEWLQSVEDLLPEGWAVGGVSALDEDERFLMKYRPPRDESEMSSSELIEHKALEALAAWVPVVLPQAREYQGGYRVTSKALNRDLEEDLQLSPEGVYDFGEECAMTCAGVVAKWFLRDGDKTAAENWLADTLKLDIQEHVQQVEKKRDDERPEKQWEERIQEAASVDRLKRIGGAISRNQALGAIERALLASQWQEKFKALADAKISIADVRKMMAPVARKSDDAEEKPMPGWCQGWYYVTHNDQLYRQGTSQWVSTQGFNAMYQREIEPDEDGRRPSAHRVALDDHRLPVVEVGLYAPHLGPRFTMSERECVNTFMPNSIPPVPDSISDEGRAAVQLIENHIKTLCANREAVYTPLLDWITFTYQNPGVKIRYSPILKGIEGDGKTLLSTLISVCLGAANVRPVMPQVLMSTFNGYAEGVCVVALEEVRMAGHNRYDAINALKPLITNDTVDIHKKGQDNYTAINTVNYIAFTNHGDALPIDKDDRRWMVIFTPWSSAAGLEKAIGDDVGDYFDRIHDAMDKHADALRYWLANRTISPGFRPNGRAPSTPEKAAMRAADADDSDEIIEDLIKQGGEGFNENVISTKHLTAAMTAEEFNLPAGFEVPRGRGLAKILQRMGWTRHPTRVRWQNDICRVWVKNLPLDEVESTKAELDKTAGIAGEPPIPF